MTTSDNRQQLITKLKELFQMDQADLDFGIYRIMNAKRGEITRFLQQDLMPNLRTTLEKFQPAGQAEKQAALEEAIKAAHTAGFDPKQSPKVQQLRAELSQSVNLEKEEETIYSDLTTFFSRYYQGGDFMSLRRYKEGVYSVPFATPEIESKFKQEIRDIASKMHSGEDVEEAIAKLYSRSSSTPALPYEGEEVKLHWANADQYYIKTAENFTRYAFKTPQGRVRFELIAASTERDNVKASAENERRFILAEHPLAEENGELVIYFEFRTDLDKRKQKELNTLAVSNLLALPAGAPLTQGIQQWTAWQEGLASVADPEKNKSRSLLEKHLSDYTAKNTFDYFIHKDLGKFLRRELDFFIKNEVMHLDDIEDETAPKVEQYLARIKAMRQIAHKIIAFLAQLENFQKKLWLKKKFVLETQWLITLDRIDESFYPEICEQAENPVRGWDGKTRSQRELWAALIGSEALRAADALTPELLKQHPFLMLDTAFLGDDLKNRLMSSFTNLEENTNGLLVQGENLQSINLLAKRYQNSVNCFYIDPPYNTGGDGFAYKDNYKHSSWLSFLSDRIKASIELSASGAPIFVSIDDNEISNLKKLMDSIFGESSQISNIIVQSNKRGQTYQQIAKTHEYLLCYSTKSAATIYEMPKEIKSGSLKDKNGFYELWELRNRNPKFGRFNRPNLYYPIFVNTASIDSDGYALVSLTNDNQDYFEVTPTNSKNEDSCWRWSTEKLSLAIKQEKNVVVAKNIRGGGWNIYEKSRKSSTKAKSIWDETEFISEQGTTEATALGLTGFGFPKPTKLIEQVIKIGSSQEDVVCDYFSGTGTTAHAIININRENNESSRKFICIEVGDHFDTALLPRVQKAAFSSKWSGGTPENSEGLSLLIKYIRIESYEDASNNLGKLEPTAPQAALLEKKPSLREGYVLHYMLDIESRQQLLDLGKFADPFSIEMTIVRHDDAKKIKVDVIETFNYLLGLRIETLRRIKGIHEVIGTMPNGDRTLILWRNTQETNNDALDEWFRKQAYNSRDREFDLIYVNGDNNLENLRRLDESWKVRLIEEAFQTLMFDVEDV